MIPDSMRQRLQLQAAVEHPDADLLTAFAEHALAGKEREGVLLHLGACATCREIVALSLPESSNVEVVAPASQPWFRWPVLRWTAVAATVIVVGAAVSVLVPRDHPAEVAAPAQPAPATAEKQTEPVTSGLTADKVASQSVEAKKPVTRNEVGQRVASEVAAARPVPATPPPPSPVRDTIDTATAQSGAPQSVPQTRAADALVAEGKAKSLDAETSKDVLKKEDARKDAQLADAAPAAAPTPPKGAAFGGSLGKLQAGATVGKVPASGRSAAEQNEAATALRQTPGTAGMEASNMSLARAQHYDLSGLRWHVSTTGSLERSSDGKTWEKVDVDPAVTFRALSSNAGDLWAGGTNGALFHSPDAGRTWSRTKVGDEGRWVTDTITAVDFLSARNGTVTTESGVTWTTSDAGRTWRRRP